MASFTKTPNSAIIAGVDAVTLSTLADGAAIKQDNPIAIQEDLRILSIDLIATLTGSTNEEGPIYYGIASDDLTAAEIASAINVDGPLGPGDIGRKELAERPVFVLGAFMPDAEGNGDIGPQNKRHSIRWTFYNNAGGYTYFAFNASGGVLTTGAVVRLQDKIFGVWVV